MSSEELNELVNLLATTPLRIQALLDNFSDQQLRRRPSEDQFSLIENVCHLRDIEIEGYATRINRILDEDRPVLADIDGGRLAVEREYNRQDVTEALFAFSNARDENVRTLTGLDQEDLSRKGTLDGVGLVSLEGLVTMMSEHDAGHLDDIERTRRQLTVRASHSCA